MRIFILSFLFVFMSKNCLAEGINYDLSLLSQYVKNSGTVGCDSVVIQGGVKKKIDTNLSARLWFSEGDEDKCDEKRIGVTYSYFKTTFTIERRYFSRKITFLQVVNSSLGVPIRLSVLDSDGSGKTGFSLSSSRRLNDGFMFGLGVGRTPFSGKYFITPSISWKKPINSKLGFEFKTRAQFLEKGGGANTTFVVGVYSKF